MSKLIKIAEWNGAKRCNVVFVHGLGGHPYDTWRSNRDSNSFWPTWLAEDLRGATVLSFGYVSPSTNWLGTAMPLLDEAALMLKVLLNCPELRTGPITFVCHSLGGLLVKSIIRSAQIQNSDHDVADLLSRIRQVVFLATPHTGATQATALEKLSWLTWPSASTRNLVSNNPELRNLNIEYRRLVEDQSAQIRHLVFYEMRDTLVGRIVSPSSGDPGLPKCSPTPIPKDHITIAKPERRDENVYVEVKNFIERLAPEPEAVGKLNIYPTEAFGEKPSLKFLVPVIIRLLGLATIVILAGLVFLKEVRELLGIRNPVSANIVSLEIPPYYTVYREYGRLKPDQQRYYRPTQFNEKGLRQFVYSEQIVDSFKESDQAGHLIGLISIVFGYLESKGEIKAEDKEHFGALARCENKKRLFDLVKELVPMRRFQYEEGTDFLIPFDQDRSSKEATVLFDGLERISDENEQLIYKVCGKNTVDRSVVQDLVERFTPLLKNQFLPVIEVTIENPGEVDLSVDRISAVVLNYSEYKGGEEYFPETELISIPIGSKPGEYFARLKKPLRVQKGSRLVIRLRIEPHTKLSSYILKLKFSIGEQVLETQSFAIDL